MIANWTSNNKQTTIKFDWELDIVLKLDLSLIAATDLHVIE